MDLTQLQMFSEVADSGTINAAAQKLHRVPSNLTTRLKQLEDELGVELFIREKMRLRLSADGHTFLDYARRILDLAQEARQSISGSEPRGALSLAALESVAAVRIPPVLAAFHRRFPQVELDFSTGPSGELISAVLEGRVAGAFVDGPVPSSLLDSVPVFDEELVLISPKSTAPIRRARDADGSNIYAFRPNCSYRRLFERWFQDDGASPGRIFELETYHGMLACVSAGAGIALLPKSMLLAIPTHDSVAVHTLDPAISRISIHLIWRRGLRSPALTALLNLLRGGAGN